MSENEQKTEWFVDPNSGAAPQPGGFVSPAVQVAAPVDETPEEVVEPEPTPTVPDNDPEAPANAGDSNLDGQADDGQSDDEQSSTESTEEESEESTEGSEEAETSTPGSLNPRLGTPTEESQPEPTPEPEPQPEEDFSEVLGGTVKDVQKFLEENPDKREALVEAEKAGKNRSGIVDS